jgi:hypothetical protein
MKTLYALPCSCGKSIDVERSQAGLSVRCACGREVEVPTIRGLAQLEPSSHPTTTEPERTWGPRQGVVFLGITLLVLAGGYAGYRELFPPPGPFAGFNHEVLAKEIAAWTPAQSWELWAFLSQGMDPTEFPQMVRYRERLLYHQRWTWVVWGVAAVGALIAAGGGLLISDNPGKSSRRAPSRSS